jgi:hypothetical protein
MKKVILKISIFVILIVYTISCVRQNAGCEVGYYSFLLPVSFYPTDSIIKLGDTIVITSEFPDKLKDILHSEEFYFDNVDFKTYCNMIKVDTLMEYKFNNFDYIDHFKFFSDSIYNLKVYNTTVGVDYVYSDHKYHLKFNIVPKFAGVYIFEFTSVLNSTSHSILRDTLPAVDSNCKLTEWYPNFITNNGNAYQDLMDRSNPNNWYHDFTYKVDGNHCFKVVK